MDINDLVTFLRPFTDLENLSLWNPYVPKDAKLKKAGELPTLKGQLDLYIGPHAGSAFLREFSLLPLAFSKVSFGHQTWLGDARDTRLLLACRETLTTVRLNGKSFLHASRSTSSNHDFYSRQRDFRRPNRY